MDAQQCCPRHPPVGTTGHTDRAGLRALAEATLEPGDAPGPPLRHTVLERLTQAEGAGELELHIGPEPARYLAVSVLDDDTNPYRIVSDHDSREEAVAALGDPPESFVGEYLVDTGAPSLEVACHGGEDDDGFHLFDRPTPFDEDHVAFA